LLALEITTTQENNIVLCPFPLGTVHMTTDTDNSENEVQVSLDNYHVIKVRGKY